MPMPAWLIGLASTHVDPIAWQLPQVLLVIGAIVWSVGRPAVGTAFPEVAWHPA